MKKYLMTGIAALALCVGFTSCSHDLEPMSQEEIDNLEAQKIVNTYKAAFEQYIGGKVAANQTWGFSGTFSTRTRGTFSNGNEWAANNRTDCMYKVPPALSENQKEIVRIYFQTVPGNEYVDPQWENYFIQQVYKGGVDADKIGPNSTEQYEAADGSTQLIGSNHMDHLAAVDNTQTPEFVDHNKNFNHGDCGIYRNVLNYKGTLTDVIETYPVNSGDAYRHPDKINLMTNSTTKSFGYYNSNCSLRRTEYTRLVGWKTIHDWATANIEGYDGCLNDGWNRSYMGFDFEMLVDDEVYSYTKYDAEGNIVYSGDEYDHKVPNYFYVELPNGNEEVWNGTTYVDASTVGEIGYVYGNKVLYPYFPNTTEKVGLLSSNSNEYAGDRDPDWDGTDWEYYEGSTKHLSIEKMIPALQANKLPLNQYNWVVIGGTADGWYSDWIVTLTEAQKYSTPNPPANADLRVMAEDLTNGTSDEDFDFNDIVFDVYFGAANAAKVVIRAAGGTLPLRIARVAEPNDANDADWSEVHDLFAEANPGVNCANKMINTHGTYPDKSANVQRQSLDGLTCPEFTLPFAVNTNADAKNIKIEVYKGNQWVEITSEQGEPAAKFAVPYNYGWMEERTSIKAVNESFADWCTGKTSVLKWVGGINTYDVE
ncbi:MAG: hypothetical protein J5658_13860 [Prevotella sp.]|nr:hypothetical protein [Prevotella sp.]